MTGNLDPSGVEGRDGRNVGSFGVETREDDSASSAN